MKRSVLTLLLGILCAGCAQELPMRGTDHYDAATSSKKTGLLGDTPKPPLQGQVIVLNPGGGKYFTLKQAFSETGRFDIELMLQQANPHIRWLPGVTLCLTEKAPSQDNCVRFSSWEANSPTIQVQRVLSSNNKVLKITPLPGAYRYGESIIVRVRKTGDGVEFIYGAQPPLMFTTGHDIETLGISCSSALCHVRVDET